MREHFSRCVSGFALFLVLHAMTPAQGRTLRALTEYGTPETPLSVFDMICVAATHPTTEEMMRSIRRFSPDLAEWIIMLGTSDIVPFTCVPIGNSS